MVHRNSLDVTVQTGKSLISSCSAECFHLQLPSCFVSCLVDSLRPSS